MARVSAFVGHSFLEEDDAVVRKFTDFFDQVAKSVDFDWIHATEPRAQELASKVLDLIDGRNLFIGICTPNERVAKGDKFRSAYIGNGLRIESADLQTKTSDWIIQEIGLAMGRRMNIIILLENGVRKPGSLQGGIEYIQFDRTAIEKSFSRILGMITSLQGSSVSTATSPLNAATATGEEHEENVDDRKEDPDETWDEQKFDFEYFKAVIFDDKDRAEIVSSEWLNRLGSDPEAVAAWEALCLLRKTQYTDENYLSDIKSIAATYPGNASIQKSLARAYEHFGDFSKAREQFQVSVENSDDDEEKRKALTALASVCQSLGDRDGVYAAVADLRGLIKSTEEEKYLLSELRTLAAWHGDNTNLKLAMMERELDIDPTDVRKRFQLAYAHSQNDNNSVTMYHYEKIPPTKRDGATWNNLGVAYQRLSLPGLSISAFQTSAAQGETLAMSNLAEKLMSAGFLKEAHDELQRAKDSVDTHDNVAKSQVRLQSIPVDEREEKAKKLEGAPKLSQFLSTVGRSSWQSSPLGIGRKWKCEEVSLTVHKEDDEFSAKGSYERNQPKNALAAAFTGTKEASVDTYDVTISGRLVGAVLVGEYTSKRRANPFKPMGIFEGIDNEKDFIGVFDPERRMLVCLIDKDLEEFEVEH